MKDAGDSVPRTIPVGRQLIHCAAHVPRLNHGPSEDSERPIGSRRSGDCPLATSKGPAAMNRQRSIESRQAQRSLNVLAKSNEHGKKNADQKCRGASELRLSFCGETCRESVELSLTARFHKSTYPRSYHFFSPAPRGIRSESFRSEVIALACGDG